MSRESRIALPATLGEWIQGWILEDGEALVSHCVDWWGYVSVRSGGEGDENTLPPKARHALALAAERFALDRPVAATLENPLPASLGLGSSTVDVAGIFGACALLAEKNLSEEEHFALCCAVEPSDGIVFRGLALVDHLRGRLVERLPETPPLWTAALLPRRTLDTEDYRKDPARMRAVRNRADRHRRAYAILRDGLHAGDVRKICAAATLSALLQQAVMPREEWPLLLAATRECRGFGVVVAHSGTAGGVLFANPDEATRCAEWMRNRWDGGDVRVLASTSGGLRRRM
ncbi:GHMP kinase [Aminiphilus sp.]|uniref:GHMP family kinase ATP-binding protein n=1 Tax=Aminiphilus sp. TaxID=1872488 RepID=UPI002627FFFE|nr:GHMP kinase [Aminiphilus sp.]